MSRKIVEMIENIQLLVDAGFDASTIAKSTEFKEDVVEDIINKIERGVSVKEIALGVNMEEIKGEDEEEIPQLDMSNSSTFAFVSLSGEGASSIAISVTKKIAKNTRDNVCLVDANEVGTLMDRLNIGERKLSRKNSMVELMGMDGEKRHYVAAVEAEKRLFVSDLYSEIHQFSEDRLESLDHMTRFKRNFSFTVVDCDGTLDTVVKILDNIDRVFFVVEPSEQAIIRVREIAKIVRRVSEDNKTALIISQVGKRVGYNVDSFIRRVTAITDNEIGIISTVRYVGSVKGEMWDQGGAYAEDIDRLVNKLVPGLIGEAKKEKFSLKSILKIGGEGR